MKNLLTHSFVLLSFLWSISASGQAPFCKKILLGPGQKFYSVPSMRSTPDGNWLIPVPGNDFISIIKMSPSGTILGAHRTIPSSQYFHSISDVCELPNGNMLCALEYDNEPGQASYSTSYLKYFTADFTEIWSRQIQSRGSILPIGANQFIVTANRQIIKISSTGQVIWAKELNVPIKQAYALANGNLLVSFVPGILTTVDLALIRPDGSIIKSLDLPIISVDGCQIAVFPGGDILATYTTPDGYGLECQRLSSDLISKKTWRITVPDLSDWPESIIVNDSLAFFHFPNFDGPSSLLGTMDGSGNILKCVALPFFVNYFYSNTSFSNGPSGWCGVSPLFTDPGILVYSLDTSLALPNCTLPAYACVESKPVTVQNLPSSITAIPSTLGTLQFSVAWEQFPVTIQDSCIDYTVPNPFFALQDTLCVGTTLMPDSLLATNTGSNTWILNMNGNEADTLFSYAPEFLFDKPGTATVLHQVYYLGCQSDSFSQTVTVLPTPRVSLGPDTTFCKNDAFLVQPTIEGATHWIWNDQDTALLKSTDQNGIYSLSATNGICSASDTIEIKFGQANAGFGVVNGICSGAHFTPVPDEMGAFNHLWHWEPAILPDALVKQPDFGISTSGDYQLSHILTIQGCSDTVTQTVQVVPAAYIDLPPLALICSDSILHVSPDTGNVIYAYWENGSTVLERDIEQEGVFYIVASNEFCSDTAMIVVEVQACEPANIYIPNIFAPNANNANGTFQAYFNEAIEKVDLMEIYDRWGSLVFRTSTGEEWDGTSKGRAATPGVYVYTIQFSLLGGGNMERTGTVTLLR